MNTEKEIIYSIINTVKGSNYNNDEPIGERFLRNLLLIYRVDSLRKHFKGGFSVDDEVFQKIEITLTKKTIIEHTFKLPKIIKLKHNSGIYLEKDDFAIPILSTSGYSHHKSNFMTNTKPIAKITSSELTLYTGKLDDTIIVSGTPVYFAIKKLIEEAGTTEGVKLSLYSILYDPSSDPTYDWENDSFPFPAERLEELKNQILRKEFSIISQAKSDEIQNARADTISYHDNSKVR